MLVDDELIAAFYDKLLPPDICNAIAFEKNGTRMPPQTIRSCWS
ncbi:hypothetical protein ACFS07_24840 [Undibacterium arcticum]